ncbi:MULTISPECIES: Bbp19 family protein [Paraburkholderia]|uniref:Bbp19 family protein n=1 Tax=Paraburkholderia TaxID=1822464 RepID=UPI00224CD8E0|nr:MULTISPECIES: hypothetical protein [Paraburkholderia]MCX4154990.1 hypothetical protein [Paraburkholderia aspalathi]MDN7164400.1 hypothetical protein [Paraburkholderia sp. SECH2]MDQ6392885.1 hypothetical protein [Paraburkholderia aspalathi]
MRSYFEKLLRRRSFYRATFESQAGRAVLADLRRFARFTESPLVVSTVRQQVDPFATAVKIGRQEMFQRIIHHLHVDDAQLIKMMEQEQNDD